MKHKELVIKRSFETISTDNVFNDYSLPLFIQKIQEEERKNLLEIIGKGMVVNDILNLNFSQEFSVVFPQGYKEFYRQGDLYFDKSKIGGYTPNFRFKGATGIQGQITIKDSLDIKNICNSLANLGISMALYSMSEILYSIDSKINQIYIGQKDDRIGVMIAALHSYILLANTYKTNEERIAEARNTYKKINEGIAKLLLQADNIVKEIQKAPRNHKENFCRNTLFAKSGNIKNFQRKYEELLQIMNIITAFIFFNDVLLLHAEGNVNIIIENHEKPLNRFWSRICTDDFLQQIQYIVPTNEPNNLLILKERNTDFIDKLKDVSLQPFRIECTFNELLPQKESIYETK